MAKEAIKFKTITGIEIPTELYDDKVDMFATIVREMTELYARKNHDYGNSFDEGCDKIGTGYPLGRLLDKMNRLIACMGKEDEMQVNESIEDTLKDLACYSVMTLSYLRRKKKMDKIEEYKELINNIESIPMYDGRNKGIDVYVCNKCGHKFYTKYKDKGVTPFVIKCRNCEHSDATHKITISTTQEAPEQIQIHNWIRPTVEQFNAIIKKDNSGLIEHLLNSGLILEDELNNMI